MKHLRRFNESRELVYLRNELKELCGQYLPYLKDDGYEIYLPIDSINGVGIIVIMIIKEGLEDGKAIKFKWSDIKDEFLTFYELLRNNKNIINVGLNGWITKLKPSEVENISDDKILTDIRISIGL